MRYGHFNHGGFGALSLRARCLYRQTDLMMRTALRSIILTAAAIYAGPVVSARQTDPLTSDIQMLVDQNGRVLASDRFAGKMVIVNFVFSGCSSTCPTQTAQLAQLDKSLPPVVRNKLMLVSISVDPSNDTPRVMKNLARRFEVDSPRWLFATGRPADISRIVASYSAARSGGSDIAFHSSEVHLFDIRHRMIQRYSGVPLARRQLRTDVVELANAR